MSNVATLEPKVSGVTTKSKGDIERSRMLDWLQERIDASVKEPVTEVVTLTPVLARILLERNEANRPVSKTNLERMQRDITEGRWVFNGEGLIVSKDGKLNDGQHRCLAVAEAGRSVRTVIVFGPERDSRLTLDQGVMRSVGHYLGMNGYTDSNNVASTANYVWQYKTHGRLSTAGSDRPTKAEAMLTVEHFATIPDSVRYVTRDKAGVIATKSLLAFAHWAIADRAGSFEADRFIDRLIKGTGLQDGDPLLYCRNRLIETRGDGTSIGARAELIFRTWNAHRKGEKVQRITVGGNKLPKLEA